MEMKDGNDGRDDRDDPCSFFSFLFRNGTDKLERSVLIFGGRPRKSFHPQQTGLQHSTLLQTLLHADHTTVVRDGIECPPFLLCSLTLSLSLPL